MKILSVTRKTRTLEDLANTAIASFTENKVDLSSLERYVKGTHSSEDLQHLNKSVMMTYGRPDQPEVLDGVSFPMNVRVNTRLGPRQTSGVYITAAKTRLITTESSSIECTLSHKMMSPDLYWWPASDFRVGDYLLKSDGVPDRIVSIVDSDSRKLVMDICVPDIHEYYGNGLVSHNSIVANQLNINQATMGYKTSLVPLEMSSQEMISRTMSSVTGYSSIDIFLKRLASGERDEIYKRMCRQDKKIAAAGGRYTVFKPKEDLSIEELLASIHSLNADVTYIDYIGLLAGADGDDQWRKLGQIARFGKIYAENHNKVLVLLAQINEEGKLRYSQAIKEHSSLAWTFVATKESKEKGYLNIEMLKSRNQVQKPFTLGIDYSRMHVYDLKPEDQERLDQEPKDRSKGASKKSSHKEGKASDYAPDLSE